MKYKPQWYGSPIDLPEAVIGNFKLQHRIIGKGKEVQIVGMRQAIMRGQRPVHGLVEKPLRIHELVEEDVGVWMTDLPEELNQIAEMLHHVRPHGNVLVGGLGLGIVAEMVKILPSVESVTVVERSPEVIKLCAKPGYTVEQASILDYLTLTKDRVPLFDYYLLDTWQGTGESAWFEEVMPLRRIIRNRWGRKPVIHCWAEDIMLGQIQRSLTHTIPHWYYTHLPCPMSQDMARRFVRDVGLPAWERAFGQAIDRYRLRPREE